MHYDLFEALAKQKAAGDSLIMAASGFVNATLRAATVAGRIAAENPPPPETEKPDTPTGLAAVPLVSGSTFWAAFCDVAESNDSNPVVGYRFYENGVPVGQGPSPEFVMRNRTPSTAYSIQVSSYTLYRESDLSAAIVITTDASGGNPPAADTTPPTAPVLVSVEATNSTTIEATYETSTDGGSGGALYYLEIDGHLVTPAAHPIDSMVWAALQPGRTYRVRILADDLAGNRSAPSNEKVITMPGAVVPTIPGRSISGAMTTQPALSSGLIVNRRPSPPGRTITGTMSVGEIISAGSIANVPPGVNLPPVWTEPAVDTTYSFNEGDDVDVTLDATDPEGNAVTIDEAQSNLPAGVTFNVTAQGRYRYSGRVAVGAGSYPTPRIYDNYASATDVTAVPPINITTSSIPSATVGVAYSASFAAADGYGPPNFWPLATVLPAPLDAELSMDPLTAQLTGTPSVTYSGPIVVTATDPQGNVATKQFTLDIFPYVTTDDTPESMWQAQRTAPGVMRAKRVDKMTSCGPGAGGPTPGMMNNAAFREGRWALDSAKSIFGTYSLRMDTLATAGATACQWSHYIDGAGVRRFYQVGDEFFWQVGFLLNDPMRRHYPLLDSGVTAGHKIVILDRFRQTAGAKEAVWINSRARGYLASYLGLSVSQPWGNGSIQRPVPGTSDYYRHPAFNADIPEGTPTWPARQQLHGPVLNNGVSHGYAGPTALGAGIPDPNIGSPVFDLANFFIATGHVKIRSLNGEDGIYQVWGNLYRQPPKLLISQTNANFRADRVESKNADDTTSGNLGYNGINLTPFQTGLQADAGRATMSIWYQYALTSLGAPMHPGPTGLVSLPGVIDA